MSIFIAFLGGMLTLLSPCTLPVIPLLFASVRGRRGQLAIMLAGMALMFGAVSWLVTVASGWVVNLTLAGRGLALAFFALVGLSLLSQRVAQRPTSPLVALGNQLNNASSRQRGWIGSLLAGLAVGLLWAPCAGPVLGAILSLGFVHPGQATTGGLLLAYGSGGALMLFLLGWCGAALIARLRRGLAFGERLRRLAGVAMLASVAIAICKVREAGVRRWSSGWPPVCRSRSKRPSSSRSPRRSPAARCPPWREAARGSTARR